MIYSTPLSEALEVFQHCTIDYMLLDKRNISAFIKVKAVIVIHTHPDLSCLFALKYT